MTRILLSAAIGYFAGPMLVPPSITELPDSTIMGTGVTGTMYDPHTGKLLLTRIGVGVTAYWLLGKAGIR
jgi:hypothetical protein